MRANLEATGGLFFSQRLLLALVESGLARDEAYRLVQRHAMRAWDEGLDFRELVRGGRRDRRRGSISTRCSTSRRSPVTPTSSSTGCTRAGPQEEAIHA